MRWPYPYIPLILSKNYELLSSPFPLLGSVYNNYAEVKQRYSGDRCPNVVHFDLDNEDIDPPPSHRLDKLFKGSKVLARIKENYEKLQKVCQGGKTSLAIDFESNESLYIVEMLNLFRNLLNDIYFFDNKEVKTAADKKEFILARSKIDKTAHKALLNTQMFSCLYS